MRGRAAAFLAETVRPNSLLMAVLAFLAVTVVLAMTASAPYLFKGATLEGEVATQLRATTGLAVVSSGRASFGLLPAPHIEIADLHLAAPDGALAVEAGALEGDVRLLPLIVGRLELASATLERPKLTIDLDAHGMPADSTIGRALQGLGPAADARDARLGSVTLVDGTAHLKSRRLARPPALEDIDVTLDWPEVDSPATLTGSLLVDGVETDVAAWLAQPSTLMRGETSPIALRIRAAPIDLSANGDIMNGEKIAFHGHMAASTPSLAALLERAGAGGRLVAPFTNAAVNSDATIQRDRAGVTTVDLQGLRLDLDGNRFEGALAYENDGRPSVSGTLATDTLALAPFLAAEPSLADAQHHWSRTPFATGREEPVDFDLRLSASHLKVAAFTIDDAALSVMTRGDRTEMALNEGQAYGGAVKGRASIGMRDGTVSLRGAGTVAGADLAGLGWDAFGRQLAAGALSGSLNVETTGDSPAALMAHLQGWAKGRASDGEISGLDLGRALRAAGGLRPESGVAEMAALRRGRTPFTSASFALRLADGVATIEEGRLEGPGADAAMTGSADIGTRGLDLTATAVPPPAEAAPANDRLAVAISGGFDAPVVRPLALPPAPAGKPAAETPAK